MKKRMSRVATRKKTIEANISATYTSAKKQLQREKKSLNDALSLMDQSSTAWVEIAVKQKDFAELIETEAPIEGGLHASSTPIVAATRAFQADASAAPEVNDKAGKMIGHVKAYLAEIDSVEAEFKNIETLFTETQRYEKKVGKLTGSKEKKAEKTKRNLDKLEGARAAQQSAVDSCVERMQKTSGKFESMLQCVQTAFWLRQDKFVTAIVDGTTAARTAAEGVSDEMEKLDVTDSSLKFIEAPSVAVPETPKETPAEPTPAAQTSATTPATVEPATEVAAS